MGQSQDAPDTAPEHNVIGRLVRQVAPGVHFASDGMLTADSLDTAIAYLRGMVEPSTDGI